MSKYANDAPVRSSNSVMKKVAADGQIYLCLFAAKDIDILEEIRYDYGDGCELYWRKVLFL